jgi:hypothetical protein
LEKDYFIKEFQLRFWILNVENSYLPLSLDCGNDTRNKKQVTILKWQLQMKNESTQNLFFFFLELSQI